MFSLTVNSFLTEQTTQIRSILDKAFAEGDEAVVEEAKQLQLLLDYMKCDFCDQLEKTINTVASTFKIHLIFLSKLTFFLKEKNKSPLEFLDRTWEILLAFPQISGLPQARRIFSPSAIPGETLNIYISGNFPDAKKEGLAPTLCMNRYWAQLVQYTENQVHFSLPFKAFEFQEKYPKMNYGELFFPKEASGWMNPFNSWAPQSSYEFTIPLASAPISPGKLELSWTEVNEEIWERFDLYHIGSIDPKTYRYPIKPGWKMIQIHSISEADCKITSEITPSEMIFSVESASNLTFQFYHFKKRPPPKNCFMEIPLKWGEKKEVDISKKEDIQISFTAYDDDEVGPIETDLSHRLVTIHRTNEALTCQVKFPHECAAKS